jgi:hypothetical protein
MAEQPATLDDCQVAVDVARAGYKARWTALESSLVDLFPQPNQSAAALCDIADEYGAEYAVNALNADLPVFDDAVTDRIANMSDEQRAKLIERIDALLDARDAVDTASRSLNDVRVQTGQEPIVHIGDRAYAIESATLSARSLDGKGDMFTLDVPHAQQPTPTLSEQARAIEQIEKAVTVPEQSRTRGR